MLSSPKSPATRQVKDFTDGQEIFAEACALAVRRKYDSSLLESFSTTTTDLPCTLQLLQPLENWILHPLYESDIEEDVIKK